MSGIYNPTPADVSIANLFRPDWSAALVVDSSWNTDIALNQSDDEARRGLVDRPFRTVTVQHTGISEQGFDAALLSEMIATQTEGYPLVPIWSDFVSLTAPYTAAGLVLQTSSTAYRRFFVGQTVFVVSLAASDAVLGQTRTRYGYATATVSSVGANSLGVSGMAVNFAAGARVFPALRSNMVLDVQARLWTRGKAQTSFRASERAGTGAAPALWTPGSLPSGEPSYAGYPVLTLQEDWSTQPEVRATRQGSLGLVGLDNVADIYGERPRRRFQIPFTLLQRAQAWRLLRFFDSRGGRLHPLWYPGSTADLSVQSYSAGSVLCRPDFPTVTEATKRVGRHLAFVLRDGSVTIRRVTGVSVGTGGQTAVAFTPSIDPATITPQSVRRVSWCYLGRFDQDGLQEQWLTDETLRTTLSVMELRNNGDAESVPSVPDLESPTSGEAPPPPWGPDSSCFQAPVATVPMFQTPCSSCDPDRPVFRVADVSMPGKIRVRFLGGKWSKDAAHSDAAPLANLLARLQSMWILEYDGAKVWDVSTSRHWHHLSSNGGGSWSLTDPTVTRHLWSKSLDYTADDGSTKTIEVRFVAEFETTPTAGHWGCRFYCAAFSNEINPTFVDGTMFAGVTHWRDDPGVWDGSAKVGHPQLAALCEVPTTFESPCGYYRFIPLSLTSDVNYTVADANANYCAAEGPFVPWLAVGAEKDNSGFGTDAIGYRGMTLNSGCSTSEVMEFLVCENTPAGTGLTAFKPTAPGWLYDDAGGLDFVGGSSAELVICDPGQTPSSCCSGHASTDNAGTATCWKPSATAVQQGCFSRSSRAKITLTTVAGQATACYDPDGNVSQETNTNPTISRKLTRVVYADAWDCTYVEGGVQTGRQMRWVYRERDAKATDHSAVETFDDNLLTNWSQDAGTWTATGGRAVLSSVSGSEPKALLSFTPYASFQDVEVSARVGDPTQVFGLALRLTNPGGGYDGYYFEFDPAGSGTATIYGLSGGARSAIAQTIGTVDAPVLLAERDLVIVSVVRSRLTMVKNHPLIFQLAADDCAHKDGAVGLASDGAAGQSWDDVTITDRSIAVGTAVVTIDENGFQVTVGAAVMPGYNGDFDDKTINAACGVTVFDCCRIEQDYVPKSITESQASSVKMGVPPGGGRPASMPQVDGVIGDFVACVVEFVDNGDCGTAPDGFEVWSDSQITKVATP